MSEKVERHELEFDKIVTRAKDKQTIELYFMAVLPDGRAINVTQSFMPEVLEEIGPLPRPNRSIKIPGLNAGKTAMQKDFIRRIELRGERLSALMNRTFNPMLGVLIEKLIAMHYGELE